MGMILALAMAMAAQERSEVYYSGHVQGVGFRDSTRRVAADFDVTGYVENLDDGRVHLVVEGEPDETAAFLAKLQARMARYIKDRTVATSPATGEFDEFFIRH